MSLAFESDIAIPDPTEVREVLIFRTAQRPQVSLTLGRLRALYPAAGFSVMGRQLEDPLFEGMRKFEIRDKWISLRSYRAVRKEAESIPFDIAVFCLNCDHAISYGRVSRVMRRVPARLKLFTTFTGRWHVWHHSDFVEGSRIVRWAVNAMLPLLYPATVLYLLFKPAGPQYLPAPQRRPAPRYES